MNTALADLEVPTASGRGTIRLMVERLDLAGGEYFVNVGLYQQDWEYSYDTHEGAYPLRVVGIGTGKGILSPPLRWSVSAGVDDGFKQSLIG
jgi:lipopolysaccharide transport system ATP-binding protein